MASQTLYHCQAVEAKTQPEDAEAGEVSECSSYVTPAVLRLQRSLMASF